MSDYGLGSIGRRVDLRRFDVGEIERMKLGKKVLVVAFLVLVAPGVATGQEAGDSGPADSPAAESQVTPGGEGSYQIQLRQLEERVADLKEKIFNSKSRLVLLKEQILHNVIAEAKGVIVHRNRMGAGFTLEQVLYHLDGNKIYFQDNKEGVLDEQREFEVFNGNLLPGNHLVSVEMVYRGSGGLFSYVDGYRFKISSSYTFYASKGRIVKLSVVGHERGGLTTSLEDKPYVSYEVEQFRYNKENLSKVTKSTD